MALRVEAAFDQFRADIEINTYDRQIATNRKNHLVGLLNDEFRILEAFATGSLPRYTDVRDHADLDVFVVLHYGEHFKGRKPSQVLEEVRAHLAERKQSVRIRRNGQAITLYYKTWPPVDVVPACQMDDGNGGVSKYKICDMHREEWIYTNPPRTMMR